ncbi:hypothetical protein HHE02_14230 [Helicobacter heilmannii]|uniref:hypothetical protein n=1 Tax=Helicobacter heilmannii TaxID=35817 RepID=UPI0006A02A8B|nr:hypothetical protein [Helicobacter heilmannii]GMB95154.1 hypothetical protein NHP21011_12530 [Helicobacter heilmannii]CRF48113.1 hypothetical protein HHE02_14230 [Helicobacter heilmannii]CRF50326.1 hypothetical protein HHE06_01500 [Helicobacter heilmannii]
MIPDITAGRGALAAMVQNIGNLAQAHAHLARVTSDTQGHLANMASKYHNLALSAEQFNYQKEKDAKEHGLKQAAFEQQQAEHADRLDLEKARLDLAKRQQNSQEKQWQQSFGFNKQQADRSYGLEKQRTRADVAYKGAQTANTNADTYMRGFVASSSTDPQAMVYGNRLMQQVGGGFKGTKPSLKKPLQLFKDPKAPPKFGDYSLNPMERG